jgi:hypothetical protein
MAKPADIDGGFLAKHGAALLDKSYHPIPIRFGGKAPGFDGWEKSRATKSQLEEWLEHGHAQAGVGILTKNTPAVDIDVRDDVVAQQMEDYIRELVGDAPVRIGQKPKRLMLFRTDKPFVKFRSAVYLDSWFDEKQQIEILGQGQQFVAYHIHPETHKPYTWPNAGMNPLEVHANDLPTITVEQCEMIIAKFEEIADGLGWTCVKARRQQAGKVDMDNPWLEDSSPIELNNDELRARLLLVPNADNYDTWTSVGMALHHQFDGNDIGLQLWHEWAETADNYDADALERRWGGFDIQGKGRAPLTARFILDEAKKAIETTTIAMGMKLRDMFFGAKTMVEWEKAKKATREAEIDGLTRSGIAQVAKDSRDNITGTKTSLVEIKKAIAYSPTKGEKAPGWAKPWVYDTSDDRFYSTSHKISATQQGFNAMFDRESMTKKDVLDGKHAASSTASDLVLKVYKIPTVNGRRYEPGQDPIFYSPDGVFANTYPEHEIPQIPETLLPRDIKNVEIIKRHIAHLLPNEDEQRMFTDWLSYPVQNPGEHVNYAVLLQGVEGDGKSFFGQMLRAIMGVSNVRMLNAHIFESDFTDWTVGQCVACIEEVRIIKATNKFEVINRVKPFITNDVIEVHPKGKPVYNARNTTSYLLFSNFQDALPIDDDSRRFLILFSQWQRKERLDEFIRKNPNYYTKLYAAIEESPGAIRAWLLDHEVHADFNAKGNAPITRARKFMVRQAKPSLIQDLEDIIEEGEYPLVSDELIDMDVLQEAMLARGSDWPVTKALHSMMQRAHFQPLGRVRIGDSRSFFWTKEIERFTYTDDIGTATDFEKVRNVRRKKIDQVTDDDEL